MSHGYCAGCSDVGCFGGCRSRDERCRAAQRSQRAMRMAARRLHSEATGENPGEAAPAKRADAGREHAIETFAERAAAWFRRVTEVGAWDSVMEALGAWDSVMEALESYEAFVGTRAGHACGPECQTDRDDGRDHGHEGAFH